MIGGVDIHIPTMGGASSIEVAVRAIRQLWPHSVFENGESGVRYDRFWQIPFGELDEIFVYCDVVSADLWDAEGAIPAAYNRMVHLVADEDMITVVVDEKDTAMERIIAAISSALSDEIFYVSAELAA